MQSQNERAGEEFEETNVSMKLMERVMGRVDNGIGVLNGRKSHEAAAFCLTTITM